MTPEYAADGKICRMRLYPKRIAGDINYLSPDLPFEELRNVLNQLVPVNKRGVKRKPFGSTATGGPAAWTIYSYQEVTFTFVSAFSSFTTEDSAPLKKGDFVFPKSGTSSGRELGVPVPSDDDFLAVKTSHPEIVAIEWNGRKCVEK
jgi:hypothetical protein